MMTSEATLATAVSSPSQQQYKIQSTSNSIPVCELQWSPVEAAALDLKIPIHTRWRMAEQIEENEAGLQWNNSLQQHQV